MPRTRAFPRALRRAVLFVGIYYLLIVYPPLRMLDLLRPEVPPGTATLLWVTVFPVIGRLLIELAPGRLSRAAAAVSMTWAGACCLFWVLLIPWEVANLVVGLPDRASGLWLLGVGSVLVTVGIANALVFSVRRLEVEAGGDAAGRALVQLSDVHLGSRNPGFLRRLVDRTRSLSPDLVLVTGDLVDVRGVTRAELAPLAEIEVPVYFAIGNHERYVGLDGVLGILRGLGVRVLRNEAAIEGPFQILGIDDAPERDQVERRLACIPVRTDRYSILLYHRPDGLEAAAAAGIDLMLSGHTHDGQVVPFNFLVKRTFERIRGLYRSGRTVLYVSPGSGTWGPVLRLGSRNEVTYIRLV